MHIFQPPKNHGDGGGGSEEPRGRGWWFCLMDYFRYSSMTAAQPSFDFAPTKTSPTWFPFSSTNEPCRHPADAILPLEACGVDAAHLMRLAGFSLTKRPNTAVFVGAVLYGGMKHDA